MKTSNTFFSSLLAFAAGLCTFAWFKEVIMLGIAPSISVFAGPLAISVVLSTLFTLLNRFHLRNASQAEKTRIEQLELTQVDLIRTLSETAEARSGDTGAHIKRVSAYSELLAKYAGLSKEECSAIGLSAPLHDIGKLAIPDEVLNKPGRLTSDEFAIMRTHTEKGRQILSTSKQPLFEIGALIAYGHHEKWNGSGYPRGLAGESIPLEARIVAIADVFDALSAKRVYKEPWTDSQITEYLEQESGVHFDPNLIPLFMDNFNEFVEIRRRYTSPSEDAPES